jgi:hypothetical protein
MHRSSESIRGCPFGDRNPTTERPAQTRVNDETRSAYAPPPIDLLKRLGSTRTPRTASSAVKRGTTPVDA